MTITKLYLSTAAAPQPSPQPPLAHADLIHHWTFDRDLTDSGTLDRNLIAGAASELTTDCSRLGGGLPSARSRQRPRYSPS